MQVSTFLCKVFRGFFLLVVKMIQYRINDPFNIRGVIEPAHWRISRKTSSITMVAPNFLQSATDIEGNIMRWSANIGARIARHEL